MRRRAYAVPTALAALVAGAVATAPVATGAATEPGLQRALRASGGGERLHVIATVRGGAAAQARVAARAGLAGSRRHPIAGAVSARATPAQVRRLAADPAVERIALDPPVATGPAAARGARLLQARGDWALDAVRAPLAWRELGVTGRAVRIGTIDTGIDPRHPALAGKVVAWRDVVAGRPAPYDDNGHGTQTAGVLVGGSPGRAPLGAAPGAKLMVAKAIPASGLGRGSDVLAAAEWLADPDGDPTTADHPQVISNSWAQSADANDPWFRPVLRRWRQLGIVAVFAAGNAGPAAGSIGSPAGYPEALAVGGLGRERAAAAFSSRGPVAWRNPDGLGPPPGTIGKPDLSAPGVDVLTAAGAGEATASGTSVAAPMVAGVAALVRSASPALPAPEVERILRATAVDAGPPGRDDQTGAGMVDALAAVRAAGASRARPLRARARVRLTVAQLRITRRIAVTAAVRVHALRARLGMPVRPRAVPPAARRPIRRLDPAAARVTGRVAQTALRGAAGARRAVAARAAGAAPVATASIRRPSLGLGQVRRDQRLAQAALRRAAEAERAARAAGLIPPG